LESKPGHTAGLLAATVRALQSRFSDFHSNTLLLRATQRTLAVGEKAAGQGVSKVAKCPFLFANHLSKSTKKGNTRIFAIR
jgi:hypothetical protein